MLMQIETYVSHNGKTPILLVLMFKKQECLTLGVAKLFIVMFFDKKIGFNNCNT
jgi:hypothetical protein